MTKQGLSKYKTEKSLEERKYEQGSAGRKEDERRRRSRNSEKSNVSKKKEKKVKTPIKSTTTIRVEGINGEDLIPPIVLNNYRKNVKQ